MKFCFLFIMQDKYMFACKKGEKLSFLFILQENVFTFEKGISLFYGKRNVCKK